MANERCELCGKELAPGEFYVVRIDVFADPKMAAMSKEELDALDFDAEMDQLLDEMKGMTADEVQDQVHRRFEFGICAACQRGMLANLLGKKFRMRSGGSIMD